MKKFLLLVLALLSVATRVKAQDYEDEHHHVALNFIISPDVFSMGLGYHYMVAPALGLGGSIGFWSDPENMGSFINDTWFDDDDYYYDYYDHYYSTDWENVAFFFEPSILIRTPGIQLGGHCTLGLSVNPWFRISTNHYSSSWADIKGHYTEVPFKSRWWSVGCRVGPTLRVGPLAVTVGYELSNIDVDRRYRSSTRNYSTRLQHGVAVSIAGYF